MGWCGFTREGGQVGWDRRRGGERELGRERKREGGGGAYKEEHAQEKKRYSAGSS